MIVLTVEPPAGLAGAGYANPKEWCMEPFDYVAPRTLSDAMAALNDGRRTLAQVIGTDPESDLAVLKVDLPELPVITLGDSNALHVGDAVLAIVEPRVATSTQSIGRFFMMNKGLSKKRNVGQPLYQARQSEMTSKVQKAATKSSSMMPQPALRQAAGSVAGSTP